MFSSLERTVGANYAIIAVHGYNSCQDVWDVSEVQERVQSLLRTMDAKLGGRIGGACKIVGGNESRPLMN